MLPYFLLKPEQEQPEGLGRPTGRTVQAPPVPAAPELHGQPLQPSPLPAAWHANRKEKEARRRDCSRTGIPQVDNLLVQRTVSLLHFVTLLHASCSFRVHALSRLLPHCPSLLFLDDQEVTDAERREVVAAAEVARGRAGGSSEDYFSAGSDAGDLGWNSLWKWGRLSERLLRIQDMVIDN